MTGWLRRHPFSSCVVLAVVLFAVLWAIGTIWPQSPHHVALSEAWIGGCGVIIGAGWVAWLTGRHP